MNERLTLSVPETARLLGIGVHAMYQAVKQGRIPTLRFGRKPKLRIPRVAVERLLEHPELWEKEGVK